MLKVRQTCSDQYLATSPPMLHLLSMEMTLRMRHHLAIPALSFWYASRFAMTCLILPQTEQVSHHPPISSFKIACPDKGIEACGVDQIAARVTGTALKVHPGIHNKGICVNITSGYGEGETYWITHPTACVNGILRGSFYATITDSVRDLWLLAVSLTLG